MGVEVILNRLQGVVQTGKGWSAHCPAHDDQKRSLGVYVVDDGRIILKCYAGCTTRDVMSALGLKWSDVHGEYKRPDEGKTIAATYQYTDENGKLLYEVVRFEPKSFAFRRPSATGDWIWRLGDVRRVIFNLPVVLATPPDEPIWFVEGEKDATNLIKAGFIATCICGGSSSKWVNEYTEQIASVPDRRVNIICDADSVGREFAWKVAANLCGHVNTVTVIDLFPSYNDGRDVSDFLESGGRPIDLMALADQCEACTRICVSRRVDGTQTMGDFF